MLGRPNEALPSSSCSESDITGSAKLLDKIRQAQTQCFRVEAEETLSLSSGMGSADCSRSPDGNGPELKREENKSDSAGPKRGEYLGTLFEYIQRRYARITGGRDLQATGSLHVLWDPVRIFKARD